MKQPVFLDYSKKQKLIVLTIKLIFRVKSDFVFCSKSKSVTKFNQIYHNLAYKYVVQMMQIIYIAWIILYF